jgi:hypothetical protein
MTGFSMRLPCQIGGATAMCLWLCDTTGREFTNVSAIYQVKSTPSMHPDRLAGANPGILHQQTLARLNVGSISLILDALWTFQTQIFQPQLEIHIP